nr:fibronectin type III domain-containing protein [Candidatus Kapabacteria bacterium]
MKNTWLNAFVMAVMALVFVACNENESPTDPVATAPNAPTALAAQSVNGTTIGLRWTAPTTGVTPTSYEVEYNAQGTTAKLTKTVATGTSTTIDGLEAGTVYDFVVYAYNGTAKSIASSTVSWAAANRGTGTFRLYSSLNSTNGSGLAVWSDNTAGVKLIAEGGKWDICFDDKTNPADPRIASPGQTDYTVQRPNGDVVFVINGVDVPARITYWGKQYTSVAS